MVHTFEIYTIISVQQARRILSFHDIPQRQNRYRDTAKVTGIAEMSLYPVADKNHYILKVIVNPAKLLYGYDAFETVSIHPSVLQQLIMAFAAAMDEAAGEYTLPSLADWFVRRIDYAVDIYLEHPCQYPGQYVKLLNKGDKPKSYLDKGQGKTGSCYWSCKSTTGNIYDKADQMMKEGKTPELVERARNLLRFEVQCKSPKIGYLRKNNALENRKFQHFFCSEIAQSILLSYCRRAYKTGDYYTFRAAQAHMKRLNVSKRSSKALGNVLKAIAQSRSISEARKQVSGEGLVLKNTSPKITVKYCKEQFGRNCSTLKGLSINPVTIPREWKVSRLPGVYSLLEAVFSASEAFNETSSA